MEAPLTQPTRRTVLRGIAATGLMAALGSVARAKGRHPNILFVSFDDMNDWAGLLGGHPAARTPNIDALARRGLSFENAHCSAPICNPSRTSLLTGLSPATTGVYENKQPWRRALPGVVSLPALFRKQGWHTLSCGKVFHEDDKKAWDELGPGACERPPDGAGSRPARKTEHNVDGIVFGPSRSNRDAVFSDARVADTIAGWLKKDYQRPFFMGCGFFKPHLSWVVPQRYFDLYPLERIGKPLGPDAPDDDLSDVPEAGRRMVRLKTHQRMVRSHDWKLAMQAYLASLSFADAQLGRVLDALRASPHAGETLICVWSDHGWALGEKSHWKKGALWEECTRVPLVFAGPGVPNGARCERPVSLLDLYPTFVSRFDLEPPPQQLEGHDLSPLIENPDASWAHAAVSTEGRGNHAVRTQRWRYIRYADGSEELYDHNQDPNEWTNLARRSDMDPIISELRAFLPTRNAAPVPTGPQRCTPG